MNKVVLKQLIDDAIKFEFHRSFDYEGSILFDNLSLIDIHNNYKWFSEKHSLNNEEKAFFILELIKHYQFGSFLYNIDENLQNKIIEMFNAELNDLNQKEDVKLKNDAKEKITQITPIKTQMKQTQIVYLFEQLIEKQLINVNHQDNLWSLVSKYFSDVEGKTIKNIHQTKSGKNNIGKGKPKRNASTIEQIVSVTKNKK